MTVKTEFLDLNIDIGSIKNHEEYRKLWDRIGKVEIKMVEKHEEWKHNLGNEVE